jgi:hypothetical protein
VVAKNGDLHLVFANVELTKRKLEALRSTIQMVRSRDRGQTWCEPQTISVGEQRSWWFVDGYQGPAIVEASHGDLFLSWADYYGNRVHFSKSRSGGADFDPSVSIKLKVLPGTNIFSWILGATFGTPCTELAADATGRVIVISVHEAHAMGRVLLVGSQDGGLTWSRCAQLAPRGTKASLKFDSSGRLHAIWTELRDQRFNLSYAISSDHGHSFSEAMSLAGNGASVALPKCAEREERELALGSYQSLVLCGDGRASAFWVDLRDGLCRPRLYQSTWDI